MIRRRAELDTKNPPGQIVNRPTHVGTLQQEIEDYQRRNPPEILDADLPWPPDRNWSDRQLQSGMNHPHDMEANCVCAEEYSRRYPKKGG